MNPVHSDSPPIRACSGDWTAGIDDRGRLVHLALGPVEVLLEVAGVVRDDKWGTIPPEVRLSHVNAGQHDFDVRFSARHAAGSVEFAWDGHVIGSPEGEIRFEFSGTALTEFETNRIGLVLLHPLAWAGKSWTVRHPDGTESDELFPLMVSPFQPFTHVTGFSHRLDDGRLVDIRLEGSVFETEDQRNWSDASFKTYAPPLSEPFPVSMRAGDKIRQAVTISLTPSIKRPRQLAGAVKAPSRQATLVVIDPGERRSSPLLGWGFPPGAKGRDLEPIVHRLNPGHLRVDLIAGEDPDVGGLADLREADHLDVPLEVAVHVAAEPTRSLERLATELSGLRRPPSAVLIFDADAPTTTRRSTELLRTHVPPLPGAALGVGTDDNLAELLRNPVHPRALRADFVSFSTNPQVHDETPASIMRTAEALGSMIATARSSAGCSNVAISPLTLRPRRNIYVSGSRVDRVGRDAGATDKRQTTSFAAAWLVASYSALSRAGVARLTVAELQGPRGLAATDGRGGFSPYPIFHVAKALSQGTELAACSCSNPAEVEGLAVLTPGGLVVVVANLTGVRQSARVSGLPGAEQDLTLTPYEVWLRSFPSGIAQELPDG